MSARDMDSNSRDNLDLFDTTGQAAGLAARIFRPPSLNLFHPHGRSKKVRVGLSRWRGIVWGYIMGRWGTAVDVTRGACGGLGSTH